MSELPEGWVSSPIGKVTTDAQQCKPQDDFIYIDISSINRETKIIENPQTLTGANAPSRARKIVKTGDVLVSMTRPNLNAVALVPPELDNQIASTGLDILRSTGIDPRWLFYLVRSNNFVSAMSDLVQGALYPAVRSKDIRDFEIPLAPLAEQKRIADKLDALLARVDGCRARLARVPAILKRFRQAVLAAATSGALTAEWREVNSGVEPANEMIERISKLSSKPTEYKNSDETDTPYIASNLPESWVLASVESIGQVLLGRQRSPQNHNGPYMRPYMRAANITWNGWNFSDVMEMNFDPNDFEKFALQFGDVLINEGSGSADEVGKPAIWKGDIPNCCFQNTLLCVRPYENMSQYLYFLFLHTALSKTFVRETRGVNIFHIGKQRFSSFLIPIPPLEEQHEIVRRVETLFGYADRLEARYTAALTRVERLTPALLAKAFRGELVAQDSADEPAALLLERVQAARGAMGESRARRRPGIAPPGSRIDACHPKLR